MLAVFFLILQLGVGFMNQAVLASASRAAAREVIRGKTDEQARLGAERVIRNGIAADGDNPKGFLPMISWTDDPADTGDDIRVVLKCPDDEVLNEGEVSLCIQRNEEFDDDLNGSDPPWLRATVTYDYEIPGVGVFLPDALSSFTLSAQTTMRSF
jgi:hypothetical protein